VLAAQSLTPETTSVRPVPTPEKFRAFARPSRYKAAWGGRGGGKSHFFAEEIALRCAAEPLRVMCIRQVQNSIKESVHQLIADKIKTLGLEHAYTIKETEIESNCGAQILFKGMQHFNALNIQSLEGCDIAWVEEAQSLSQKALDTLRPTVRKKGSELWFSWNPRHETDAVDKFFRGPNPPDDGDAIVVNVNWDDNPWFYETELPRDKAHDFRTDPDKAEHIWNGGYQLVSEGAYYAKLITQAERENRITIVPYTPESLVTTAWDMGISDPTAIWFMQIVGLQIRVLEYYENNNEDLAHYAEYIRSRPYRYAEHLLPHDAGAKRFVEKGITTISDLLRPMLVGPVRVIPLESDIDPGIERVRRMIPKCVFDRQKTDRGLKAMRNYCREFDEDLQTFKARPLHNWASHGADAFRTAANGLREVTKPKAIEYPKNTGIV
jgi:phage terminase large subunit